jgi:hypothetical protein
MDPITTLVLSSAVGGAAGSFIKEVSSNGVKWLVDLVTAQSPEMQAIAKRNMENFVNRLAKRVEQLEKDITPEDSEIFRQSLNHPSSAMLIKAALVDAATTDNEDKHELLAELISQRLTAGADDMIALAGTAACSIVNSLSSRQIKILAVLCALYAIRPLKVELIADPNEAKKLVKKWWSDNITPLADDVFKQAVNLDFEHLAAMGCIRFSSIGSSDLKGLISNGFFEPKPVFQDEDLVGEKWYEVLNEKWQNIGRSTPTSTGQMIGILHKDAKLKSRTKINW